jgi:hypothetical protein
VEGALAENEVCSRTVLFGSYGTEPETTRSLSKTEIFGIGPDSDLRQKKKARYSLQKITSAQKSSTTSEFFDNHREYHHLFQSEMAGEKRTYQLLSKIAPKLRVNHEFRISDCMSG